ncbi:hypothetical protein E3E12_03025 [Formicincola oecophyllae]|uniref:Uncharacterized protein n=1 Tax=Formicincola oecophyllae TaxID=2558361 RepID=A0A4Y6U849_9PROT|nr:hypothetical protein [Formicincola oecophyllae]QDH13344.1 hypothetical protein E3E12_03025 [Formicincola oecophyllae]
MPTEELYPSALTGAVLVQQDGGPLYGWAYHRVRYLEKLASEAAERVHYTGKARRVFLVYWLRHAATEAFQKAVCYQIAAVSVVVVALGSALLADVTLMAAHNRNGTYSSAFHADDAEVIMAVALALMAAGSSFCLYRQRLLRIVAHVLGAEAALLEAQNHLTPPKNSVGTSPDHPFEATPSVEL